MAARKGRLAVAGLLVFLAAWTLVPPPTHGALVLAVGAPEVGAWLILLAGVVAAFASRASATSRAARLTNI